MLRTVKQRLPAEVNSSNLPPESLVADSRLVRQWLLEVWLTHARWTGPLLCLPLLWLPARSHPLVAPLAIGIAAANATIWWLLHHACDARRLRAVQGCATVLEWLAALAVIGLRSEDRTSGAQATLLVLPVLAGVRYGRIGLLLATTGVALIAATIVGIETAILHHGESDRALRTLADRELLVILVALVMGGVVQAGREWVCWTEACHTARLARELARSNEWILVQHQNRWRLSDRELDLLRLLASEELTYEQVGARRHISAETVKSHVRHIGVKFGPDVRGRRAVIAFARANGLLPERSEIPPASWTHMDQAGVNKNHPRVQPNSHHGE